MIKLQRFNNVSPIERILSSASYFTAGMVGFVWLIVAALLKKRVTQFLMYHILQSIFIAIMFYLIFIFCNLISAIPILNNLVLVLKQPIAVAYGFSILQLITTGLTLYLIVTSLLGMYSYVPWVSDVINANIGRK